MADVISPAQSRRVSRWTTAPVSVAIAALLVVTIAAAWDWTLEQVAAADVGGHAFAFAPDGTPTMAYSLLPPDQVRFATRGANGAWWSELVDSGRNFHNGLSLAYRSDGRPGISYGRGPIKLAEKTGSGWTLDTVLKGSTTTNNTSLVYRGTIPHISFSAGAGKPYLVFAYRSGSKWIVETADKAGDGAYSSLAFDGLGRAVIAYAATTNNQVFNVLKLAVRSHTGVWTTSVIESGATGYGVQAELAFSASGNPAIVHGSGSVRLVEFIGDWASGSGAWTTTVLEEAPFVGGASFAFDGDDPVVTWRQVSGTGEGAVAKIVRRFGESWETPQTFASFAAPVDWISGRVSVALHDGTPGVSLNPQAPGQWSLFFAQAAVLP